jgi:hypothetical protein
MKKFLCGLAVLPFVSAAALAQPIQLSQAQMDAVSAGFTFSELDRQNTSTTGVGVGGIGVSCASCYLVISSPNISIASAFGPSATIYFVKPV